VLQKLYNEAKDRKISMETLNRYGGKFVKEVTVSFAVVLYANCTLLWFVCFV